MKAPFAYFGGKTGMARLLVSLMPAHRVYIEPFFGSGAVLFAKPPAVHEVVNDIDGALVNFFRVLRDRTDELERVCALTPYARGEYEAADLERLGGGVADELEWARRFWVRVSQSFAQTAGRVTGWSMTVAQGQGKPSSVLNRIGRFRPCADRLLGASIECCDAADLIRRLARTTDTVVYCDPPYHSQGRTTQCERPQDYRHDSTPEMHRRLAEVLHETPATVLLSGYPTPLYDEIYADWEFLDLATAAHSSNSLTAVRTARVERVWSNRPLGHVQERLGLLEETEAL